MAVSQATFYHFLHAAHGRWWLSHDHFLGLEILVKRKCDASQFYSDVPFDVKDWIDPAQVLVQGVVPVDAAQGEVA